MKSNKTECICINIYVYISLRIYIPVLCVCMRHHWCVFACAYTHTHTHTHTHTPQFPSLQSFLHCTTTFQPAFWPLRPVAFALAGRLQGQKNEFLTLPTQEFYHSCCNPGRSHFHFCIGLRFFFFFFAS